MRLITPFLVLAATMLVLVGCGGDDPTPTPAPAKTATAAAVATPTPAPAPVVLQNEVVYDSHQSANYYNGPRSTEKSETGIFT